MRKNEQRLYRDLAEYYDIVFKKRNYKKESEFVRKKIQEFKVCNKLLDVGCGTGNHDKYFRNWFDVVGTDINEPMLKIARTKNRSSNTFEKA